MKLINLIENLVIGCIVIIAILLLSGCSVSPVIKTVNQNQDNYEMPDRFILQGIGDASVEELMDKCEGNINGCIIPKGNGIYTMYFTAKNVAKHEFDHLISGPAHN